MRWYKSVGGDIRIITRFLLIPRCIKGQWRWLETAKIKQTYDTRWCEPMWVDVEWVNE